MITIKDCIDYAIRQLKIDYSHCEIKAENSFNAVIKAVSFSGKKNFTLTLREGKVDFK